MEEAEQTRKKIEVFLATAKRGMTLTEIAENVGIPVSTAKRHLDRLASIGRVHIEAYRGFSLYKWNGKEVYQDRVYLSENHVLFIDAMVNPWGKPFVRIKERKEGRDIGAIIIDEERVSDFIAKLDAISKNIKDYGKLEANSKSE
jgi:predicted ArsR family transcriptional regulator